MTGDYLIPSNPSDYFSPGLAQTWDRNRVIAKPLHQQVPQSTRASQERNQEQMRLARRDLAKSYGQRCANKAKQHSWIMARISSFSKKEN